MSKQQIDWENYYEIHEDKKTSLEGVVLKRLGQRAIANFYRKKYDVDINVIEYKHSKDEKKGLTGRDYFYFETKKIFDQMKEGEAKGIVFTSKFGDETYNFCHTFPYVLAKINGQMVFVGFYKDAKNPFDEWRKYDANLDLRVVKDFNDRSISCYKESQKKYFQKDDLSCATFALNALKNCLLDDKFLQQLFSGEKDIIIDKKTMAQGRYYIDLLDEEKKEKYVHAIEVSAHKTSEINLKAFYKAHYYARMINPDHLDLLDEKTRELILKIDRARGREGVCVREFAQLNDGEEREIIV